MKTYLKYNKLIFPVLIFTLLFIFSSCSSSSDKETKSLSDYGIEVDVLDGNGNTTDLGGEVTLTYTADPLNVTLDESGPVGAVNEPTIDNIGNNLVIEVTTLSIIDSSVAKLTITSLKSFAIPEDHTSATQYKIVASDTGGDLTLVYTATDSGGTELYKKTANVTDGTVSE